MAYRDLRDFLRTLEKKGELKRISEEVDPILEITEITDRTVKADRAGVAFRKAARLAGSCGDESGGD